MARVRLVAFVVAFVMMAGCGGASSRPDELCPFNASLANTRLYVRTPMVLTAQKIATGGDFSRAVQEISHNVGKDEKFVTAVTGMRFRGGGDIDGAAHNNIEGIARLRGVKSVAATIRKKTVSGKRAIHSMVALSGEFESTEAQYIHIDAGLSVWVVMISYPANDQARSIADKVIASVEVR